MRACITCSDLPEGDSFSCSSILPVSCTSYQTAANEKEEHNKTKHVVIQFTKGYTRRFNIRHYLINYYMYN